MATQKEILEQRIPMSITGITDVNVYDLMIDSLLEDSKNIALSNIYPFKDWSELDLPTKYYNWQIRAAIELYNLADKAGIKSYSENGLSWSKSTDLLSQGLMEEITPRVGVLRQTSSETE
jgi:hypothetical protein